jgi:hypothetical protein
MAIITSRVAERIADEILSSQEEIFAISIIDESGRGLAGGGNNIVLASKAKESFRKAFGLFEGGARYGGTLGLAALGVASEVRGFAGRVKSIVTTYEKCKMMLLPMPSYDIVVGLVIESSVNAEDYNIGEEIERLLAKEEETGDRSEKATRDMSTAMDL